MARLCKVVRVAALVAVWLIVDAGVDAAAAPVDDHQALIDRVWSAKMMVSPDGKQIFQPISHSDGARGAPNLEYEIWNRAGKSIRTLVIQTVDDYIGDGGPPGVAEKIWRNEQAAAKMLDALAAAGFTSASMQKRFDAGEIGCFNPGFLRGAAIDLTHRVALVTIGYRGNDSCWEGDDDRVRITW